MTAPTNTAPRTMYWMDISMPIRFIPEVRDIITRAPIIEPVIVPTPPAAETPPTKAAAMASVSKPSTAVVVADCKREAERMPERAERTTMKANTRWVIRATLIRMS